MSLRSILLISVFFELLSSCNTQYIIKSDPPDSEVYLIDNLTKDRKLVGKTPLIMPSERFKESFGHTLSNGEFMEFAILKDSFEEAYFLSPPPSFASGPIQVNAKLKQKNIDDASANQILNLFFNAQKFTSLSEFDRAHIEIDKILKMAPHMARAYAMHGAIYYVEKKWTESLAQYEQSLKYDPQMDDAIKMIAELKKKISSK